MAIVVGSSTINTESEMSAIPIAYIEKGTAQFRHTSLALFAGGFSTFALLYGVQPLMPAISKAFVVSAAQSSLILSVALICLMFGLLLTGPLSDAFGRKKVMVVALFGAAVFTLCAALMSSWAGLLVMRALVGLSLSGLTAVAMTYLSEEIHPRNIGLAMGLFIGGNAIGGMTGRLAAGLLADSLQWNWVMGFMGVFALIAALLFWRFLPESKHFRSRPLDSGDLLGGYRLHLQDTGLRKIFLMAFFLQGSFITFYNYVNYHLQSAPYHYSQTQVALLSFVFLIGIWSSAVIGNLADRVGRDKVLWVLLSMMIAGLWLTVFEALVVFLVGVLLFTFSFFGAHTVASSWIGRRAFQARGQATSLYQVFFYLGASVMGTIGGVFWSHWNWPGVCLFIAAILLLALGVSRQLSRLPDTSVRLEN